MWWIKFRKKYLLPLKWKKKEKKQIDAMKLRASDEVFDRLKETKERFMAAERKDDHEGITRLNGELAVLNWITYVGS